MSYHKKGNMQMQGEEMKLMWKRKCLIFFMVAISIIAIGCKKKSVNEKTLVLTVDETKINMDEMMYYIWKMESECIYYEDLYKREYNIDYWEQELEEGVTTRDFIKQDIIDGVIRTNIIWKQAIKDGMSLTNDEEKACEEQAAELLKSFTKTQKEVMQITKETLTDVLKKEKLVDQFYAEKVKTFTIDEEAIKASIDMDLEEYEVDMISILKDEIIDGKTPYQEMEELLEMSKESEDWSTLIEDSSSYFVYESFAFTEADEQVEQIVKDNIVVLEKGEISNIIETNDSYVILKLINKNKTNAYEEAVESAIKNAEFTEFETYYQGLKKEVDVTIEENVWNPLVIGHITIDQKDSLEEVDNNKLD